MAYRNEQQAAQIRCESLRRELEEIDRHLASARAIASRRAVLATELDAAVRTLDRAQGGTSPSDGAPWPQPLALLRDLALAGMTVVMLGTSFVSVAAGAAYLVARERSIHAIELPPAPAPALPPVEPPPGDS